VSEIYTDDDRSAFSGKPRPDYLSLLANVRLGLHDGVMAWRLDRLHRRMSELEDFISITEQAGVALATVTGDVDISTSSGRLMARTMGAFGMLESEVKSERIRRKHQELAERGKVSGGGTRPFGYTDSGWMSQDKVDTNAGGCRFEPRTLCGGCRGPRGAQPPRVGQQPS